MTDSKENSHSDFPGRESGKRILLPTLSPDSIDSYRSSGPERSRSGIEHEYGHNAKSWISGYVKTAVGKVPRVDTRLSFSDRVGSYKARWTIGRMQYRVKPGLYAVGNPTAISPVFVTANYKMSFDRLRSALDSVSGWIMVIDTLGINVWCAAGKGTFGTDEMVARIKAVGLKEVVSHRKLIVPQLGAPGVAAHKVQERSGFKVKYGPVHAEDIPKYLTAGQKTTPEMRQVRFPLTDRAVLIPTELVQGMKYALPSALLLALIASIAAWYFGYEHFVTIGVTSGLVLLFAGVAGIALPPLLLPWLPGRSFSLKGVWIGLLLVVCVGWMYTERSDLFFGQINAAAWVLIVPAVTSFFAMNFTGSSTYTSLSGVLKEMRVALPIQIVGAALGLCLWFAGLFVG